MKFLFYKKSSFELFCIFIKLTLQLLILKVKSVSYIFKFR